MPRGWALRVHSLAVMESCPPGTISQNKLFLPEDALSRDVLSEQRKAISTTAKYALSAQRAGSPGQAVRHYDR